MLQICRAFPALEQEHFHVLLDNTVDIAPYVPFLVHLLGVSDAMSPKLLVCICCRCSLSSFFLSSHQ